MKTFSLKFFAQLAFALGAIMMGVLGWVLYQANMHLQDSTRWADHAVEVMQSIDRLNRTMEVTESGQRAYLLTGRNAYLPERDQNL